MLSLPVALGLIGFAFVAWIAMIRPSTPQREALARHPRSDLVRLFTPGLGGWRKRVIAADVNTLGALRRRVLLSTSALVAVVATCLATMVPRPIQSVEVPSAVIPAPVVPEPEPTPVVIRKELVAKPRAPLPPPPPADPEEPLEAKRTQLRLFSSAKVAAVYKGHEVHGVRIERVGSGSFWDLVGIRSGDVVIELNGAPVDNPAATVELVNALERDTEIRLEVRGTDDVVRSLYFETPDP